MSGSPWDWYRGAIPDSVVLEEGTYVETTYSFLRYRSQLAAGLVFQEGSHAYKGTMFDVGPRGRVRLGRYALVHGARIICDAEVTIGDYALISWNVVVMDTYRMPRAPEERRSILRVLRAHDGRRGETEARPIHIGDNVWLGFDVCLLPGVDIGTGSVVGARSVVTEDVPPFTVVAGNPAKPIRRLLGERASA